MTRHSIKRPLRILHTECSPNWGGQEMRIVEQTQWLNDNGHQAWIAAGKASKIWEQAAALDLPFVPVEFRGSFNPLTLGRLARWCARHRIDVIDAHNSRDACLCAWLRLLGRRVVRSLHVTKPLRDDAMHTAFWKFGANRVIVTAELLKKRLVHLGLDARRIDVIGEGVDLERFDWRISGQEVRRELRIPEHCPVAVNIGMIRPDKGQLFFVEAAALVLQHLPNARFLVVGEGTRQTYAREVRERIQRLGLDGSVIMTGYRRDVPEIMAAADCIVLASVDTEAQSRIAPQAFAMKKPLVATDVGAVAELVRPGLTGWLVPGQDIPAIAQAIQETLLRPDQTVLENAYALARAELGWDRVMQRTLASYQRALG
jgi:glycosyltransferase involved in cell wall biosynthesis